MELLEQIFETRPLDKWSTREKLCLTHAVLRYGEGDWASISKALQPYGRGIRPDDWFSEKKCLVQFSYLVRKVRPYMLRKRDYDGQIVTGSPVEYLATKYAQKRRTELRQLLAEEKQEYVCLQEDIALLESGVATNELVEKWCKEIDERIEKEKMLEFDHENWTKERAESEKKLMDGLRGDEKLQEVYMELIANEAAEEDAEEAERQTDKTLDFLQNAVVEAVVTSPVQVNLICSYSNTFVARLRTKLSDIYLR